MPITKPLSSTGQDLNEKSNNVWEGYDKKVLNRQYENAEHFPGKEDEEESSCFTNGVCEREVSTEAKQI